MLTVHQVPPKNLFLPGISSRHDKIFYQNEAQPITSHSFTGDCTFDFLGKENCRSVNSTLNFEMKRQKVTSLCGYLQIVRHIKTEENETDFTNNFIDFINFL